VTGRPRRGQSYYWGYFRYFNAAFCSGQQYAKLLFVMDRRAVLLLALLGALIASGQTEKKVPRKVPGAAKPECSQGAICFSGEALQGTEFRKALNGDLEFSLETSGFAIVPKQPRGDCREFTSVVNGPYRQHREIFFDTSYGWTADQEVTTSPREFRFVTNCADYQTEYERLMIVLGSTRVTQQKYDDATAALGTLARGKGRVWITDSKISHADDTADEKLGKILWLKFSVEILLPAKN